MTSQDPAACCPKRIDGNKMDGNRLWTSGRAGPALSDFKRLGHKVVKVVKKAPVFGHSVAEKAPADAKSGCVHKFFLKGFEMI